ncbi:MAG: tRNA(Ile)-lysidine synthase [Clostridia bacterium]|nr:tRNA(Ile)-lysidine synthase [Clostridia bacterium]
MLDKVRRIIQRYNLLIPGDKVVVGVSGGPDSLALLHSLKSLQEEFGFKIHVAHLNHGLRQEASADAEFVQKLAAKWSLPVTIKTEDVLSYQKEHHLSLEAAAREVRYSFFEHVATEVKASKIAVGHQADDQAETVLLNLLRGSGLTGLKAMLPKSGRLIRPLLFVRRSEVELYCKNLGLNPREDVTNNDPAFRRNKIRHQLMPLLAKEYNPAIINVLSRTAIILQEDEEVLSNLAKKALSNVKKREENGKLVLDRQEYLGLPPGLQRRVLRLAAANLGRKVSFKQVEEAREVVDKCSVITWPGDLRIEVNRREIYLQTSSQLKIKPFLYYLKVPGITPLPELGKAIKAEFSNIPSNFRKCRQDEAWLDWEKLDKPLLVRDWKPGDVFRPLGMCGRKKLQDFFVDSHIPMSKRHSVPLVISGDKIAWVAGLRLADDFKISSLTRVVLHLELINNY